MGKHKKIAEIMQELRERGPNLSFLDPVLIPYNVTVYSLSDRNGDVFYVGCTTLSLKARLRSHLLDIRMYKSVPYVNRKKVAKINSLNGDVVIAPLETGVVNSYYAQAAVSMFSSVEKKWIAYYKDLGFSLCNSEYKTPKRLING